MSDITDPEFGIVRIRRLKRASHVRVRIGTDGRYVITAPPLTPLIFIKRFINQSRDEIRALQDTPYHHIEHYADGQLVGKSHRIGVVNTGMVSAPTISRKKQVIIVQLPEHASIDDDDVQRLVRDEVIKALRVEAKAYLPKRLKSLAVQGGFNYQRVRFSHSGGRWGSCSSTGTISLNIALMKLPHELIDYVLIHELSHTRHMNHSPHFWSQVEQFDPHFRLHRRQIKQHTPTV